MHCRTKQKKKKDDFAIRTDLEIFIFFTEFNHYLFKFKTFNVHSYFSFIFLTEQMFFFFTFLTELTEQTVSCRYKKILYSDTRPFPSLSFESIQTEKESSMLDLCYVPGNYSSLLIIMRSRQREM